MKKIIFLITLLSLFYTGITQAQIAVNEDNSLPDASALMDIKSTNKGLLIPRMTTAERAAIPMPATGLMVYDNTTNSFWYYNVSAWTEIGANAITIIQDADNDTKIQVEESADEDIIRFDLEGSESLVLRNNSNGHTMIDFPSSNNNIFMGNGVGQSNTTGHNNVFNGRWAGYFNTTGRYNVFMGLNAGYSNTAGDYNIFIGATAGVGSTTGGSNIFIGRNVGRNNTTGSFNIFNGQETGNSNTTGSNNVFTGDFAGFSNTVGNGSVFIGNHSGYYETNSNRLYIENSNSTSPLIYGEFDNDLLRINGTLNINNAFSFPIVDGTNGQTLTTDGSGNVTWANANSSSNTLIQDADNDTKIQVEESADEDIIRFDIEGSESLVLKKNATGDVMMEFSSSSNLFMGDNAGQSNTTGNFNIFTGNSTGQSNTTGSFNIFTGSNVGRDNTTGTNNVFTGTATGRKNTTGSDNTFTGTLAGTSNTIGNYNVFNGYNAGAFNTTGSNNTFSGYKVGIFNTTGSNNTFIGEEAGFLNQTGSGNVFLGSHAGHFETGSNKLYIENSSSTSPLIYGEFDNNYLAINGHLDVNSTSIFNGIVDAMNDLNVSGAFNVAGIATGSGPWNNSSDRRLKTNIQTVPNALEKVLKLRGVTYDWKDGREKGTRLGFIAQEVDEVLPQVIDKSGEFYTMQYAPLTAVLVEAIQEQQEQIEQQEKLIQQLQTQTAQIEELKTMMTELQAQIKTNNSATVSE